MLMAALKNAQPPGGDMRIYLAGPLFTEAEQNWHRAFKKELEEAGYQVVWPYELLDQEEVARLGANAHLHIFQEDKRALEGSDIVVALLDGPQVDDGTAWEIGYAYALEKPVFGIRTDFRNGGDTADCPANAMIAASCVLIATSRAQLLAALAARLPA